MTKTKQGIWLVPTKYTHGAKKHWVADLRAVGQGRKFFDQTTSGKKACQALCDQLMERERQLGQAAWDLTMEQYAEAKLAFDILGDRKKRLSDIVREWVGSNELSLLPLTVGDAVRGYECHMREKGLREATIKSAITRATRLGKYVKLESQVGVITTEKIERFFRVKHLEGNTARSYWTELKVWLDWLVEGKYLRRNPILAIPKPEKIYKDIEALQEPNDLVRIFQAAEEIDPNLIIPIAIRFFAGIRAGELERMKPEDINLDTGYIRVSGKQSKTRRERYVQIEDNLRQILETWDGWDLTWTHYRWSKVTEKAEVHVSANIARKSYISYHLRKYKDIKLTNENAGHSEHICEQHYLALVSDAQAAQYWKVVV